MFLLIFVFIIGCIAQYYFLKFVSRNYEGNTFMERFTNFTKTKNWLVICLILLLVAIIRKNPITISIWSLNILVWMFRWFSAQHTKAESP